MSVMQRSRIKICGLRRVEDIEAVNRYLPDYAGFIIDFPKSHRSLSLDKVQALTEILDRQRIKAVGVFVDAAISKVADALNCGMIDMAQLHGTEDAQYIRRLRNMTDGKIIKAFTVRSAEDVNRALESEADHILLDQGQGSGRTFDWSILGERLTGREWFLAGGISQDNIAEAIRRLHPFAVDLSSAVETDKLKDPEKIRKIINIVRNC